MESQFAFPVSPSHWGVGTLLGQVKQEAFGSTFSSKFYLATWVWELSQADKMQNVNYIVPRLLSDDGFTRSTQYTDQGWGNTAYDEGSQSWGLLGV